MTTVYVQTLNYFYDDYKRSESKTIVVGVSKDKNTAYRNILTEEYNKNKDYCERDEEVKNKDYDFFFNKLKEQKEFSKEFLNKWEDAREAFLGESEFGSLCPTGNRFSLTECVLED
jgi:hypothetical protein